MSDPAPGAPLRYNEAGDGLGACHPHGIELPSLGVSLLNGGMGSEDWRMNDGDEVLISLVALVVCTVLLIYFFVYF